MRYVVIFKAQIKSLDEHYSQMAQKLRNSALQQYHCQHFESLTEHNTEIALSYWNTLADIQAWRQDAEHIVAQTLGQSTWYTCFSVDVCEILRHYQTN
jgi:heme-degrading monooxygenase HmoA